jgi:hypothetical protein
MELLLKDGMAFLNGRGYTEKKDLLVYIKNTHNKKVFAKINNLPKNLVKNSTLTIPKELLENNNEVYIEITVQDNETGIKEVYKSDRLKIREAIAIGESVDDCYPTTLTQIRNDIAEANKQIIKLQNRMEDVEKEIKAIQEEGDLI